MIRVLVAEDSALTREYLVRLLQAEREITVAGAVGDGMAAVRQAEQLRPDVILLDADVRRMNVCEATREIMARAPTRIIITADLNPHDTGASFSALEAGALGIVAKPRPNTPYQVQETLAPVLIHRIKLMSEVPVVRRRLQSGPFPGLAQRARERSIRLIAMGASTGGPPAVAALLRQLSTPPAVLLVQHIAAGFIAGFAAWLRGETGLAVKLAQHGERPCAGTVYIAPDGSHMGLGKPEFITLLDGPRRDGFRPSITYLFQSVADVCGPAAAGVLLGGMGRDGAVGLAALRAAGAVTFAQDAASCVVFSMPQEAIRLGAAEYVLSPAQIGYVLRSLLMPEEGRVP